MTGVNKVHAMGNKGKGVKVGIIDSGVDYTHPALGGGFGPVFKDIGGYDFVGDNYPNGDPVPDNDPLSQCNGHGTHVAGIVAADPDNEWNVTGVAPEASINSYRIFGCDDGADDSIVVDALLRAYEDGNGVITLSLGGDGGWQEGTSSVVESRIADSGREQLWRLRRLVHVVPGRRPICHLGLFDQQHCLWPAQGCPHLDPA